MAGSVGESIKRARRAKGLSQEELAALLTVSRRTVGEWERTGNVPEERLSAILRVLGDDALDGPATDGGSGVAEADPQLLTAISGAGLKITIQPAQGRSMGDVVANLAEIMEAITRIVDEVDQRGSESSSPGPAGPPVPRSIGGANG